MEYHGIFRRPFRRVGAAVLLLCDETVAYGDVVYVMTLLQKAGAPSVGLITKPPEQ